MHPFLRQIKADIRNLSITIRDQFGIDTFRVAFVAYRDWLGGGERLETLPFTEDISTFEDFVGELKAEGGDDAAEDVLGGLQASLGLDWRAKIKILYHICDAPPHGTMFHELYGSQSLDVDDAKGDEDSDNADDYNDEFIQSRVSDEERELCQEEKDELDRFPDKHPEDPDHVELLEGIKEQGIEYWIGKKTEFVEKYIRLMIADGKGMGLEVKRIDIPWIKDLLPSLLQSIQYAIRLSHKTATGPSLFRPLEIRREGMFRIHVGIDFGTDGSAFAVCTESNTVFIHKWGSHLESTKTKSNILLDANGAIVEFGTAADKRYCDLMDDDSDSDGDDDDEAESKPMFFKHFKMALYGDGLRERENEEIHHDDEKEECQRNMAKFIQSVDGRQYESSRVLQAALSFIKEEVMKAVVRPHDIDNVDQIQWILSVPAIWSNRAKYIMENCAQNAGMIHKGGRQIRNHLLIAYEPDCAAISIRNEFKKQRMFETDDRYLLLDLGGGTADIACHQVDEHHVKEIMAPSGGPWGASYIDLEFEKLLRMIFKKDWVDAFQRQRPDSYVSMLNTFKSRKENFEFGSNLLNLDFDDNIDRNWLEFYTMKSASLMDYVSVYREEGQKQWNHIALPFDFISEMAECIRAENPSPNGVKTEMEDDDDRVVSEYVAQCQVYGGYKYLVKMEDDSLCLEDCLMRHLFDSVLDPIVMHCGKLLSHSLMRKTKYIVLVGGFSSNMYLQRRVHYEFGHLSPFKMKVITPAHPILSVVDGAARYGLNRDYISSRTLNKTYGVSIEREWGEFKKCFPETEIAKDQLRVTGGSKWVKHCFFPFVRRNDVVRLDDEPEVHHFEPVSENADKLVIELYESTEVNPVFTNDRHSKLCARREYALPKNWGKDNESGVIPVAFFFGDSRIRVFVGLHSDQTTEKDKEIDLDFDAV